MRALIVEDNPCKRQTVERILAENEIKDYDVAMYGIDANKLIEEHQYEIIILDLGFCARQGGKYGEKEGLIFLENMRFYVKRKKIKKPKVIVFSETYLTPSELEENALEKAENEIQLREILSRHMTKSKAKKVLVVEDEKPKLQRIIGVLEQLELNYVIASYSEKAKEECFKNYDVDIIICDMKFPIKKDGELVTDCGINLLDEIENTYKVAKKTMPPTIVYSTIDIEEIWRKQGKTSPKWFVAQTIVPMDLKYILKSVL